MNGMDVLVTAAVGGGAALLAGLALSALPSLRLATRRALLIAALAVAALAPLVAWGASAAGVGLRSDPVTRPVASAPVVPPPAAPIVEAPAASLSPLPSPPPPQAPMAAPAVPLAPERTPIAWGTLALLVWAAGALLGLARTGVDLARVRRLRRSLAPCDDPRASAAYVGAALIVPATVGILRPVVAFPSGLLRTLDDADLAAILRHEGSHARRRDPLAGLLARVAASLHWPNPLAHAVARRLGAVCESLADGEAVREEPSRAARYATCLVRLASGVAPVPPTAGLHAIVGPRGTLTRRVEALLDARRRPDPRGSSAGRMGAVALAVSACVAVALATTRAPRAAAEDAGTDAPARPVEGLTYVGRVLDPDGKPVEGAIVYVDNGMPYQVMVAPGLVPWRSLVPDPLAVAEIGPYTVRAARPTGADGRFAVAGVTPPVGGTVRVVHAAHATLVAPASGARILDATVDVGDLRMATGAELELGVCDPAGGWVEGAWVVAQPEAYKDGEWPSAGLGAPPGTVRVSRTDAKGLCRLQGLSPGEYVVAAFTDRRPPSEALAVRVVGANIQMLAGRGASVATRPGLDRSVICLSLPEGRTLTVEVVDRVTRSPRPGCRVALSPPDPESGVVRLPRPGPIATATTDAKGLAAFDGLDAHELLATVVPADQVRVANQDPPPFSVRRRVTPGARAVIELDPVLHLAVRLQAEGAPVPVGLRLQFKPEWAAYDQVGGFPSDVVPEELGLIAPAGGLAMVDVPGLRPGTWRVYAFAKGCLPFRGEPFVLAPDGTPSPEPVVVLRKATAQVDVVVTAAGGPLPGARVKAYEWIPWLLDGNRAEAVTDARGTARLTDLLGEGYPLRLEVEAKGYLPAVSEVAADARASTGSVLVRLARAGRVFGRWRDGSKPVAFARVDLLIGDGSGRLKADYAGTVTTDAEGRFAFENVKPGEYALSSEVDGTPVRWVERLPVGDGEAVERDLGAR